MKPWIYILIIVILAALCFFLWSQLTDARKDAENLKQQVSWMEDQAHQAQQVIERLNRNCHR